MKKPPVSGILGVLFGVGIGAAAMRWFDWRAFNSATTDSSTQPVPGQVAGQETDPVCSRAQRSQVRNRWSAERQAVSPRGGAVDRCPRLTCDWAGRGVPWREIGAGLD